MTACLFCWKDREDMADRPTESSLGWIERLIAHHSISSDSNMALIDEVSEHFTGLGLDVCLTTNVAGTKANLFATLPGRSGCHKDGLILSGHTDVVPVDGQDWSSDPFAMDIRQDRLYGRGACDMKGFLGVAIALAETFAARPPSRPVHYALSYDEELGCLGAPSMISDLVARGYRPRACIVGEPTDMMPVVSHKASRVFECHVQGKACHSADPDHGVNAIHYATRLIMFLQKIAENMRSEEKQDLAFDPPFSTLVVGTIQGGVATNTVPESCVFTFAFRTLPTHDDEAVETAIRTYISETILPDMRREDRNADVVLHRRAHVPAMRTLRCDALIPIVSSLGKMHGGCVSYGTEAGLFQKAGIETLVCGPGSILHAHKADEFVTLEQLGRCETWLRGLVSSDT
ncbi:acetylornithine deacetylase [Brytella acorum]|nr:acetylornithine deacetylase [Brytella acorum]